MKFNFIFFVLQICLFWTAYVDALRCFACTGVIDGPCFNPASGNVPIINCEEVHGPGEHVCFKAIDSIMGAETVFRGCHPEDSFAQFCAGITITGGGVCLSCRQDLCNSSNIISPVNLMILILALLIIFK